MYHSKIFFLVLLQVTTIQLVYSAPSDALSTTNQSVNASAETVDTLQLTALKNAINDFGVKFLGERTKKTTQNIAFSPLSIYQVFAMIVSSAREATLNELKDVFEYKGEYLTPSNVDGLFKRLSQVYDRAELEKSRQQIKLSLESLALHSPDFDVQSSFKANLRDNYRSRVSEVDFKNGSQALNEINGFVNQSTNGLIPQLIDSLDPGTVLALVNAFYFKGEWVNPFEKYLVQDRAFHNADKTTSESVKTMHRQGSYNYYENEDLQIVSLPYRDNVSMVILLPKEHRSVADIIKTSDAKERASYSQKLKPTLVDLYLPKFKIESTTDLKESIYDMGAKQVFTPQANLEGISSSKQVYVSKAVHKAVLNVDEKGSEAAASTFIAVNFKASLPIYTEVAIKMDINRPFLYFIYDKQNHLILFMGEIKKL